MTSGSDCYFWITELSGVLLSRGYGKRTSNAKSTLSQHLNELKEAGLIQGDIIPLTTKYCINKENFALAKKLLNGILN